MEECPNCGGPTEGPCLDCLSDVASSPESLLGDDDADWWWTENCCS